MFVLYYRLLNFNNLITTNLIIAIIITHTECVTPSLPISITPPVSALCLLSVRSRACAPRAGDARDTMHGTECNDDGDGPR